MASKAKRGNRARKAGFNNHNVRAMSSVERKAVRKKHGAAGFKLAAMEARRKRLMGEADGTDGDHPDVD